MSKSPFARNAISIEERFARENAPLAEVVEEEQGPNAISGEVLDKHNQPVVKKRHNFKGGEDVGMTFIMPRDWHSQFKATAASEGIPMRDLLFQSFEAWKRERESQE